MEYMLLIIADESKPPVSGPELSKLMTAYREFTAEIGKSGHLRAGAALHPTAKATTVRQKHGKRVVTDGPFSDAKEHLAGYYVVECAHLDEAIAIAGRIPGVRLGEAIEIRPLVAMPDTARTEPAR